MDIVKTIFRDLSDEMLQKYVLMYAPKTPVKVSTVVYGSMYQTLLLWDCMN
jgi:hypothetical protein